MLVATTGGFVRINTDTITTQQPTGATDTTSGNAAGKFTAVPGKEAPSTTARMTQKGESPAMSKTRRAAGIDNKGKTPKGGAPTVE
jgi:hypothetical protein